jgi:hypothetical protein
VLYSVLRILNTEYTKSHFQLRSEMIELLVSKAKDINTSAYARIGFDNQKWYQTISSIVVNNQMIQS